MNLEIVEYNEVPPLYQELRGGSLLSIKCPEQEPERPVQVLQYWQPKTLQTSEVYHGIAEMQRYVRNKLIADIEWRLQRYERQLPRGATDDTAEDYTAALQYVQDLRDITEQSSFPGHVEWPLNPFKEE